MRLMKTLGVLCVALAWVATPAPSSAQEVDVELVLAVDVSGSVNAPRYLAQKNGYIAAFRDPDIHAVIEASANGIAVVYMEWSGGTQQSEQVAWRHITTAAEAMAFADAIEATTRAYSGLTGIANAIDWSVNSIQNNGFDGARRVIDISGDGSENVCSPRPACLGAARDAAVAAGMVINGIAIEEVTSFSLTDYYEDHVIGGDGSFVLTAVTFEDFREAIFIKLRAEITGEDPFDPPAGVPEPGTLLLLGAGLLGMGAIRRRRAAA